MGSPYCLCSTFCSGLMCDRSEGVGSRAAEPRIRSPGGGRGWGQLQKKSAKRAAKSCFARAQEVGEDIQAIFFRRRYQPRRAQPAKIRPGSPAPAMGPGTVMKVSGPVPKENVALEIVVAAVMPERWRVKVSGPTTNGLNCPPVIELLAFVKLVPEGRSS
jgi:hypothetical protein